MTRTCPNCGSRAIDDQSQFCNKCGTPFPAEEQPKKVFVRTVPRLADTPPPPPPPAPPVQQPVAYAESEYYVPPPRQVPAAPPARSPAAGPSRVRVPARKHPARRQPVREKPQPFAKMITKDYAKIVYWLGVIAILLIVIAGLTSGQSKTTKSSDSSTDDASDSAAKSSGDLLATIPLYWIGVFLFANLAWRVLCETSVSVLARSDPAADSPDINADDAVPEYGGGGLMGDSVECPRCGKIVAHDELRTCETCGTEGCTSCIRLMGLIKKKWTCRDCFEKK